MNSTALPTEYVPLVSPRWPVSVDPGFVESDSVTLWQSVASAAYVKYAIYSLPTN